MIFAQEQAFLNARGELDQMAAFVAGAGASGVSIDQVERGLWQRLLSLGRVMLQGFVDGVGEGDLGPTIEYQGRKLKRLESVHDRRYVSVFGELSVRRRVYGTRETQGHELIPTDARLGLPGGDFSHVLCGWDQRLCVAGPYEEAKQTVSDILGLGQSVASLERMNLAMAGSVQGFMESLPPPAPAEPGAILVLTADGKGVPMRKTEPAARGPRKKGEKANRKRMACVGAVYSIAPFVRTADDVVDEVLRDKAARNRPVPRDKQVRAELTRPIDGVEVNGKDRIFGWFERRVSAIDPGQKMPTVCVMDGERALWKTLDATLSGVICILDIFHVLERIWQAAHCFYAEGGTEARLFVDDRLRRILQGEVGRVIGGLKQMATKQNLRGAKLKQLGSAIGYLQNNRRFMHYDQYLAAGFPIGSGVAEGACRHLVKDRMERTGMRWQIPSAQAMLDLRAVSAAGRWDEFESYRIETETRRLYPHQEFVAAEWPAAA